MLLNIISFNLSWFGLVLLGNPFIPVAILLLGMHFYYCKKPLLELKLIVSITLIGTMVDSSLIFFNVLIFNDKLIIPFWLIILWAAFGATIAHSLAIFAQSKILQFCLGFIFPPLSYLAGSFLSVIEFKYDLITTYFIFAFIWGVLMMIFFSLKNIFYSQGVNYE